MTIPAAAGSLLSISAHDMKCSVGAVAEMEILDTLSNSVRNFGQPGSGCTLINDGI